MGLDFVAVDFEIADYDPSSACAIGLAFVHDGRLTESMSYLRRRPIYGGSFLLWEKTTQSFGAAVWAKAKGDLPFFDR